MSMKRSVLLGVLFVLFLSMVYSLSSIVCFAEDVAQNVIAASLPASQETKTPQAEKQEAVKGEEPQASEWVWGSVVSVDPVKSEIVIKHLDYETYEEVQTVLKVTGNTIFENVSNLGEIKQGEHLTADYRVVSGSNCTDLIVVEKEPLVPAKEEGEMPSTAVPETAAHVEISPQAQAISADPVAVSNTTVLTASKQAQNTTVAEAPLEAR